MEQKAVALVPDKDITPYAKLSPEQKQEVESIVNSIDLSDTQVIIQYGVSAQSDISSFSDAVLNQVRGKDSGYVGEILTDLSTRVRDMDAGGLVKGGGFFSRFKSRIRRFIARYEKLNVQIDKIVDQLDRARMELLKDVALLDNMYEKNIEYLRGLDNFIIAGMMKADELNEKALPALTKAAEESDDPMDAQRARDMAERISRFEKKIHDLKLSRMIAIQTAPQLRLIQGNDQALVEKIQSSILTTIPLWKNQVVIAISLFRQKSALDLQKQVSEATNELLQKNAELLKENSIDTAAEMERGIVEMETLKKVNDDLIATIDETLQIQQEGRAKRQQAEAELMRLEGELRQKLTQIRG